MDFALSPDQILLQDSARRAIAAAAPLAVVRAAAAHGNASPEAVAAALAEFGAPALLIGEEWGGANLTLLEAALVCEALGAAVAPAPYIASAVMAPIALARAASPEQQRAWLPRLASGKARLGVGLSALASGRRDAGIVAAAGRLSGAAPFTLDGEGADGFILADREGSLFLVRSDAPGLTIVRQPTIDATRSLVELTLKDTPAEALPGASSAITDEVLAAGRLALAADSLGAASAMLAQAVAYAGQRRQFGRLIGSFQAVKHLCAEMAAELEPCRALLWFAAYDFAETPHNAPRSACLAKSHIAEAATLIARSATEIHGGMGFTDLLGLHFWFKRIGFNRQLLGGPEHLRAEAAARAGWNGAQPATG